MVAWEYHVRAPNGLRFWGFGVCALNPRLFVAEARDLLKKYRTTLFGKYKVLCGDLA